MMGKLTKARRKVLAVIPDWTAPYEVVERLSLTMTQHPAIVRRLDDLVSEGLAYFSPANRTYRASFTGRAALEDGSR